MRTRLSLPAPWRRETVTDAESTHASLLAAAVAAVRETSPRLADLYRDHPRLRPSFWGSWCRESDGQGSITANARARLREERKHWLEACVSEGGCHGRGYRGAS